MVWAISLIAKALTAVYLLKINSCFKNVVHIQLSHSSKRVKIEQQFPSSPLCLTVYRQPLKAL